MMTVIFVRCFQRSMSVETNGFGAESHRRDREVLLMTLMKATSQNRLVSQ